MGSNRRKHPVKPSPQIPGLRREEFGVDEEALYKLWKAYYQIRLAKGTAKQASETVMKSGVSFRELCYLLALGMEIVTNEYFREEVQTNG
jgi:hypothetical protein